MPKPLIFFLLLSVSSIFSKTSDGSKALASNCPSHDCGGVNISYPFWLTSDTTSNHYCGYPRFNLTCSDEKTAIINLSGNSYYVKNISYTDKTLTLVDVAVTANQTCPRALHNVTIQTLPLSYNRRDLNLSFYFNCSPGIVWYPEAPPNATECLSSKDKDSFVFVNGKEPVALIDYWHHFCEEKVVVAVMESEIDANNNLNEGFGGVMKDGFVLDWRPAPSCGACEESIGLCGFDNSNDDFLCFCSDGSTRTNDTCKATSFVKAENKPNIPRKLAIGFGASIGTVLVMCVIFFLRQRWYKKRYGTSPWTSQNIFSRPSSTTDLERSGAFYGVHIFKYSELEKATCNFDPKKELGDGGFGAVYQGNMGDNTSGLYKEKDYLHVPVDNFASCIEKIAQYAFKGA